MSLMQMKTSVVSVKAVDSAKASSEMRDQMKECTHARHLRNSFKQKSKQKVCYFCSFIILFNSMLSCIVYKRCKRQPLCDEILSLCQNVWVFFIISYTVWKQTSL